jgi:hypothetical protein
MTCRNENSFDRFPPGFAAKRYRATPEQIERNIRESQIQAERDARHRRKLIEEGKLRPDPELDRKSA